MAKQKKLTDKQQMALELLTSGKGMKYKDICEAVGVDQRTLYRWRTESDFVHFQEALQKLNDERWLATVDAAREAALKLCNEGNQRMVEFVLKNEGYNPSQKVEAEVSTDIVINIGE
jgi:uncharacterized protein YjcR